MILHDFWGPYKLTVPFSSLTTCAQYEWLTETLADNYLLRAFRENAGTAASTVLSAVSIRNKLARYAAEDIARFIMKDLLSLLQVATQSMVVDVDLADFVCL